MNTSPYEMSNGDLLLAFQVASSNLGRINNYWGSRSSAAADARNEVANLFCALHARLDGQTPPFAMGARVRTKDGKGWTRTVESVYYVVTEKRWLMTFAYETCMRAGPFPCDRYELASTAEVCSPA